MTPFEAVTQLAKMLENVDAWMKKAEAHAKTKGFDAEVFTTARLAPDQYPFARQIQSACDAAKVTAAYLSGKKPPSHPDTEKTLAELHARLATCIAYLRTMKAADFAGAAEVHVAPPWMGGKWVKGDDYLHQLALPNFYFHVTTAYSILRHGGVDLGKADFVGSLPMHDG